MIVPKIKDLVGVLTVLGVVFCATPVLAVVEKAYYKTGELMRETPFEKDKKDGVEKWYYQTGELMHEVSYKNGKKEGTGKTFYKNGQIQREETYKNDVLDGPVIGYYEAGGVKYEASYKAGVEVAYNSEDDYYDVFDDHIQNSNCEEYCGGW